MKIEMYKLTTAYNATHHKMYYQSQPSTIRISVGMAWRLARFALAELVEAGFACAVDEATDIEIDGQCLFSEKVTDHSFHVLFILPDGGKMGVQGIGLSRYGWPVLHHGLCIEAADK